MTVNRSLQGLLIVNKANYHVITSSYTVLVNNHCILGIQTEVTFLLSTASIFYK